MSRHEQTHKIVAEASYVKLRNISSAMRRETILPGYCLLARWAWLVDCIINCPTSPQRRRREALVSELESTGNTQLHPRSPASFRTAFFFPFPHRFLTFFLPHISACCRLRTLSQLPSISPFTTLGTRNPRVLSPFMAPPPPANLPLPERLKALAQTLQYVRSLA